MDAADPVLCEAASVLDDRERLRIVDDDEVELVVERRRVERVVAAEDLLLGIRQAARVALERVVDRLRDLEELVLSENHPPFGVEAGVAHQRHERVVDLRDAAAVGGGGEMEHPLALERLRQRADLISQRRARERRVVGERLVGRRDVLELHRLAGYPAR